MSWTTAGFVLLHYSSPRPRKGRCPCWETLVADQGSEKLFCTDTPPVNTSMHASTLPAQGSLAFVSLLAPACRARIEILPAQESLAFHFFLPPAWRSQPNRSIEFVVMHLQDACPMPLSLTFLQIASACASFLKACWCEMMYSRIACKQCTCNIAIHGHTIDVDTHAHHL